MSSKRQRIGLMAGVVAASITSFAMTRLADAGANTPVARPPQVCLGERARASACRLVSDYFAALNAGHTRAACALLGERLRLESGGPSCSDQLAWSVGTPFKIEGARPAPKGVEVLVSVGFRELDHWRMLAWLASVGRQSGKLRILDTWRP
jgi:hypothetical protein